MNYILYITAGSDYLNEPVTLEFECDTLDQFKVKLLKRLGNIGGTNNAERERFKLKQEIKQAKSVDEIVEVFFEASYWHMDLKARKKA